MKKILLSIISACITLSALIGISVSADRNVSADTFTVAAKSAIAVDAKSGKILYAQNATDASTSIASITKLITAYLVYKNIDEGKLTWNTKATISQYAYDLTQNADASNIPLTKGENITIKDLMDALLLPSANSAAVALAEKIGGTEPKFVDMMNAQLKAWGITDAKIYNASGLPNDSLGNNRYPNSPETATNTMSAEDVAIVSFHLLQDYPQILQITKQAKLPFDSDGASKTTLETTNFMLKGYSSYRSGVDGLKTGSTGMEVNNFAGTTMQNGFRIITVVLEATNPATDNSTPFTLTNQLMNHVYGSWTTDTLASKGKTFEAFTKYKVVDGRAKSVKLVAYADIAPVVPRAADTTPDTKTLSVSADKKTSSSIEAPVKKGQVLVKVKTQVKDKLGYLPGSSAASFDLVASQNVDKSVPPVVWWNHFVNFVNQKL